MRITGKSKNSCEGWGMGFFLVFFPDQIPIINNKNPNQNFFSSTQLISIAQSIISICALLIFITLLLFTLSTPTPTPTPHPTHITSRRFHYPLKKPHKNPDSPSKTPQISHALQGMGTLYRRGTAAMDDLLVCHVTETVNVQELRLFLRLFHGSGLASRSDLVFLSPNSPLLSLDAAIREENDSFLKLNRTSFDSAASFNATQFVKSGKEERERGEAIWGRGVREGGDELTGASYGSVVGFEVDELDPENSLAGFMDRVPLSLRRWACYPMLLGRVRKNFKHIMLVDVKDLFLLGDPLGRVRTRSPDSVYMFKSLDETQSPHEKPVDPGIIMGGVRGIRRFSNTMLAQIVRTTMQGKRKNPVTESGILSQLAGNGFVLKDVNLVTSTESIPEMSQLTSAASLSLSNYTLVRRGDHNIDINSTFMKIFCSFPLDSSVYSDC